MTTLEELRAWTVRIEQDVADLAAALQEVRDELRDAVTSGGLGGDGDKPFQREYPTLDGWVEGWLAPVFARNVGQTWRWCSSWWAHPEAVHRLEALHRGWEVARLDPNGRAMLAWQRDLDAQLRELTSADGPFASCGREHRPPPPLPVVAAPDGWYALTFPESEAALPLRSPSHS